MKKILLTTVLLLILPYFYASANDLLPEGDKLVGIWLTASNDEIEIYREAGKYCGKPVVKPGNEERLDINNPNERLRNRSLADVKILKDFGYIGKNRWRKGTIYDPNNGKIYKCIINMKSNDTIEIRGFIGLSLFGRTEIWTRIHAE